MKKGAKSVGVRSYFMSVSPPLRKLQFVLAVARELHFRKAAERLHISQPSMSRQIESLKKKLDLRSFHRDHHFVEPTEAGQSFIAGIDEIITRLNGDFQLTKTSFGAEGLHGVDGCGAQGRENAGRAGTRDEKGCDGEEDERARETIVCPADEELM